MTINRSLVLQLPRVEWWHTQPIIGESCIALRFPYNELMNVQLRHLLNNGSGEEMGGREWSDRTWRLHPDTWPTARELFLNAGYAIRQVPPPASVEESVNDAFGAAIREAHDGATEAWITTILNATDLDELQGHARRVTAGIRRFHQRQRDELES